MWSIASTFFEFLFYLDKLTQLISINLNLWSYEKIRHIFFNICGVV